MIRMDQGGRKKGYFRSAEEESFQNGVHIVAMSILLCRLVSHDKIHSFWTVCAVKKEMADWNNPAIPGNFPLHKAVRFGLKERVETLIAKGSDINARDCFGNTPLHYAVLYFRRDIMHLLVEKGAKVNIRDNNGHTPLYYAGKGRKDMAEYLCKNGAQE